MTKLLYRGPALDVLHSDYAMRGRIDPGAPVTARREVLIAAPAQIVWELLSAPPRWRDINPAIHDVRMDGEVAAGTRFTWRNGMARMRSRMAVVNPQREISWTGVSAGIRAVHRHLLTKTGETSTSLLSEESMSGPFLPLYFGSTKLATTLEAWLGAIKILAEGAATEGMAE
jgi:polyketide cyclase/dehydrase/lipid transport protein